MRHFTVNPFNGECYGQADAENHNEVQRTVVGHALQWYLLDEEAVKQPDAH